MEGVEKRLDRWSDEAREQRRESERAMWNVTNKELVTAAGVRMRESVEKEEIGLADEEDNVEGEEVKCPRCKKRVVKEGVFCSTCKT